MGNRPICCDAGMEPNYTSLMLELGVLRVARLHAPLTGDLCQRFGAHQISSIGIPSISPPST